MSYIIGAIADRASVGGKFACRHFSELQHDLPLFKAHGLIDFDPKARRR
jgi:hypothetical protein